MLLTVNHLSKDYGDVQPLRDVSCEIDRGEVISIIGPSGTGKSTFINCLNQLEKPDAGEVWLDGENMLKKGVDLRTLRRRMGMVFQNFNLFGHLTVVENIMSAPVDLLGVSKQAAYEQALDLLETVGLSGKALAYPSELSGGQQQRVAIVRALAMKPEIMLFDEPTSALDPTMVDEVLTVIRNLAHEGLTMLIVTHEMRFAREISSRVFYMDEGVIYEQGKPQQIFDAPQRTKTRYFVKRLKVFEREIPLSGFDFPGFQGELAAFAYRQMIPTKVVHQLTLVFEELCLQLLAKRTSLPIRFAAAYEEQTGSVEITVLYTGEAWNPLQEHTDADEISLALVKRNLTNTRYAHIEGTNSIVAQLVK